MKIKYNQIKNNPDFELKPGLSPFRKLFDQINEKTIY